MAPNFGEGARAPTIGPVLFFARIRLEKPGVIGENIVERALDTFGLYGIASAQWVDDERSQLDFVVRGARLGETSNSYAASFVQEVIDLGRQPAFSWRLVPGSVRYRANFSVGLVGYRLRGRADPEATVEIDVGRGFIPVQVDDRGHYVVDLPHTDAAAVAYIRSTHNDLVRYGRVDPEGGQLEPVTEADYRVRRVVDFAPEPNRDAQPELRHGPWLQLPYDPAGFARNMAEFPPKVLERRTELDIQVHLVFDGLNEGDPFTALLSEDLNPLGLLDVRYDPDRGHTWFLFSVFGFEDISRIHARVEQVAAEREQHVVITSRSLGVDARVRSFGGLLERVLSGRLIEGRLDEEGQGFEIVLPAIESVIEVTEIDEHGVFEVVIPHDTQTILGKVRSGGAAVRHLSIDPATGVQRTITPEEYSAIYAAAAPTPEPPPAPDPQPEVDPELAPEDDATDAAAVPREGADADGATDPANR